MTEEYELICTWGPSLRQDEENEKTWLLSIPKINKGETERGSGKLAQWLTALATLAEDLGLAPSTSMATHRDL